MIFLFYIFIFILIVLPESSFMTTALPIENIILVIMIPIIWINGRFYKRITKKEKQLLVFWFLFITYIFIIDSVKGEFIEGIKIYIVNNLFFIFFYTIIRYNLINSYMQGYKILNYILLLSIVPVSIAVVQIFNLNFYFQNYTDSIPIINLVSTNAPHDWIKGGRITGPATLSNWLAVFIGYVMILCIFFYNSNKKKIYLLYFILLYIIGIFTYTRSFIWGIFPSLIVSYMILYGFNKIKYFAIGLTTGGLFFILLILIILPGLKDVDYRSSVFWDPNTGSKLNSNYFAIKGTLEKKPLFGIKRQYYNQLAYNAYIGSFNHIFPYYNVQETFHNQFGRYLILYGTIGFILFVIYTYNLFKLIMSINNIKLKFIALSSFIFLFQYSLMHNNLFVSSITFITLLGIVYRFDKIYLINKKGK